VQCHRLESFRRGEERITEKERCGLTVCTGEPFQNLEGSEKICNFEKDKFEAFQSDKKPKFEWQSVVDKSLYDGRAFRWK
jgi:hypothetical protein